jgi:hypothetical protein
MVCERELSNPTKICKWFHNDDKLYYDYGSKYN